MREQCAAGVRMGGSARDGWAGPRGGGGGRATEGVRSGTTERGERGWERQGDGRHGEAGDGRQGKNQRREAQRRRAR